MKSTREKGLFQAAAILLALLALAGCAKKSGGEVAAAAEPGDVTMRLVCDVSGIDDKSFNAAAWRGILRYYGDSLGNTAKKGSLYDYVICTGPDQYIPVIQATTDEGYDLVIATGFSFADPIGEMAGRNPNQKYMIVDVDWVAQPNVLNAVFAEHEGSYLVGVAAALKAQEDGIAKPRFGFIGGQAGPTITKFEVGYIQGIHSVIPGADIIDYYVGDWNSPDLAKTQAKNWFDSGVYIIYSAAGASGNGTIAQAKEYRSQGKNVWAIGVDSDQYEDGIYKGTDSAVYTSMLKRVESATYAGINAVKNGSFRGEVITFDLKADGVGYAGTNPAMSAGIKAKVDAAAEEIKNSRISIAATYAAAKALPGFPQDLKASDSSAAE
ncbi:MAG: BMP family ABC transporter substrate-binding protein [Treponema sp.]|nr:BMP family ABC transporter substrate-binding protein [Treponema sp.]